MQLNPRFPGEQQKDTSLAVKGNQSHGSLSEISLVPASGLDIFTRSTKNDKYPNENTISSTTSQKAAI